MGEEKLSKKDLPQRSFFLAPVTIAAVGFVACLVIVVIVYSVVSSGFKKTAGSELKVKVGDFGELVEKRIDLNIGVLYGVKALFSASKSVERNEFVDFLRTMQVLERYPNISSVAFLQAVKDKDKASFVASVRKDASFNSRGYPDFVIYPEGQSDEYYVVKYVEPENETISKVLGFNYLSDNLRRVVAEKARDTGLPQITPLIRSMATGKYSYALVLAVYKNGLNTKTVTDRREALEGFVILITNAAGLVEEVIAGNNDLRDLSLRVSVNDVASSSSVTVFEKGEWSSSLVAKEVTAQINIGEGKWLIELVDPLSSGMSPLERGVLILIIVVGVITSLLVAISIYLTFSSKNRALRLADNISRDLRESERRYKDLYELSSDAIMTLEPPEWRFTSGNPATVRMFNCRDEKEFISLKPSDLSPERQPDGSLSKDKSIEMVNKAVASGSNFFEWVHKKLTGESFFTTILLTKIDSGEKIFLQATVRDITSQKQAEEAVKKQIEETNRMNKLMVNRELEMIELKKQLAELKK